MKNYDANSENMEIHGPILYVLKIFSVKNAKKLELGAFVNPLPYGADWKYLQLFERD